MADNFSKMNKVDLIFQEKPLAIFAKINKYSSKNYIFGKFCICHNELDSYSIIDLKAFFDERRVILINVVFFYIE